ncbi:MAG: TetR/AcrR family transcriptional regulator C-terminal domain-containing protein [Lachnospiraceae bacterium]|nr:TetR/AcrR family transcriptional regulator C-terminal domain-containing protein [Lachnospiraceae bacterium]
MTEIRRMLADSFKELVQEKGFQKIIVKDITDRAKVKRPTFYTYFRDKYDVIDWIFEQEIWQPARSLISAGYTKEGLRFMLVCMEKDKAFYRKLIVIEGQNSFKEIMQRYIEEEVIAALTKSQFRSESRLLTPDTIAEYIASVFWFVIQKWMKYDGDISAGEIVEVYSLLASDSLDEIMQNKIGNLAQK